MTTSILEHFYHSKINLFTLKWFWDSVFNVWSKDAAPVILQTLGVYKIQFWHYPFGDSIRSHRLRGQFYKITLQCHRTQHIPISDASCKPMLLSVLLTHQLQIGTSHDSLLRLQTPVLSLGCYVYFWWTSYKSEVPMTTSLGSINLLELFTELRQLTRLLVFVFLLGIWH